MLVELQVSPIVVEPSWDYLMIPSERPLYEILEQVVAHGVNNPRHGTDCSCLDTYIYEIRRHVIRAVPEPEYVPAEDWDGSPIREETLRSRDARQDAHWRITHVLGKVTRSIS